MRLNFSNWAGPEITNKCILLIHSGYFLHNIGKFIKASEPM